MDVNADNIEEIINVDLSPESADTDIFLAAFNTAGATQPSGLPTDPSATIGTPEETFAADSVNTGHFLTGKNKIGPPKLEPVAAEVLRPEAAKAGALEEVTYPRELEYSVAMDGTVQADISPDPITLPDIGLALPSQGGPIETAIQLTKEQLEVAAAYPQYVDFEPTEPEAQSLAAMHPGLQRLYDLRSEILADEESYRTTDGQLKKASQNKVSVLEIKMDKLQDRLGIQSTNKIMFDPTAETMQDGTVTPEAKPAPLTEAQNQQLQRLEEKEQFEGLTTAELDTFVKLKGLLTGEITPAATRPPTAEEQAQFAQDEVDAKEISRGERISRSELNAGKKRKIDHRRQPYKIGVDGTGIKATEAAKWLKRFLAKVQFGPQVKVINRNHPKYQAWHKRTGKERYGWFNPREAGTVWIVADNHHDAFDVFRTYLHETLAHYGMRSILTKKQMDAVLQSIVDNPPPGFPKERIAELQRKGFDVDSQLEAEEYIAAYAENVMFNPNSGLVEEPFWKRLVAIMRQALRKLGANLKWTDNDIAHMLRNVSRALTGQITPRNSFDQIGQIWSPQNLSRMVGEDIGVPMARRIDNLGTVWGARFSKWFLTPLQMAERYNIEGSQEYLDTTQAWWAYKRNLTYDVTTLGAQIQHLSKADQQQVAAMTVEASIMSDEQGRKITQEETEQLFKKVGIQDAPHLQQVWSEIDKSFQVIVQELKKELGIMAIRMRGRAEGEVKSDRATGKAIWDQYTRATTAQEKKVILDKVGPTTLIRLAEIDAEMEQLSNRNYFPRMRFGNHVITIRAKKDLKYKDGKEYKGPSGDGRGAVVYFEAFETDRAAKAAWEDLSKAHPEGQYEMQLGELGEQEFHFMGVMSPQLYENILGAIPAPKNNEEEALTDQMKETLKEIYLQNAPGRSFLRHLTKRKGIEGYSADVLRVFASYHMNIANHIARLKYNIDFKDTQKQIASNAAMKVPDSRVANIVTNYYAEHHDYIMNPENDLARMRAAGFLWYLGFNVKSALVNLTQVPMVAHPYLASQYGTAAATGAITRALGMVTKNRVAKTQYSPELAEMIDRGIRDGFIDESRATELAALGENHVLQRMMASDNASRVLSETSYRAAWLFQNAEKINREVTFISAYNLAKENGMNREQAYRAGRKAVQTAMFEYSKWNRAAFMRGKKSVFFLFWQYMQGLSYIAFGGAGSGAAMRVWMMLLLAGGLQGLPYAENILDILDFVGTKSKERLGMKDPQVDLRADLRELAMTITDEPDMVMHGLSRYYGLGPLHLLETMGVPVPNVDISGSISAGNVLPGTSAFTSQSRDPNAKLGRFMVDVFGPVAGMGYNTWRAATDSDPDVWKRWERAMPSALKGLSKGLRRGSREEETYRGGGQLAVFDPHDLEARAENLAQMLGFATTRVNQRLEADFRIQNTKQYWALHRAMVMEDVAYAYMSGDPEAYSDSINAVHTFNASVPDPMLQVQGKQLQQSLKQRFRRSSLRELGLPSERLYLRLVQSMRELYPETSVDIQ